MKVIMLMAVTADGMIARDSMQLVDWSGSADKKYFVEITKQSGVMIMGSKTFDTIGRVLPGRKNIVMTRDKRRISQDDSLMFTDQPPAKVLKDLAAEGYSCVTLIGGAVINTLFIQAGLVDEVHLTMVPRFFGQGLPLFSHSMDIDLELMDVSKFENTHVLLRYHVKKPDTA